MSDIQNQNDHDKALEAQRAFEVYAYLLRAQAVNPRLAENHRFTELIDQTRADFDELYGDL